MIPGLTTRITDGGVAVVRLHYSADPARRPGTDAGEAWLEQASLGYPGGRNSARWKKEQEIDYGALGGTKLIPEWEQWKEGPIVIPPLPTEGYRLYGSYDHGWRSPSAYHVHGINAEGEIVTFWEFYAARTPIHDIATIIRGKMTVTPDGRSFPGNPYAGAEVLRLADPSIWAQNQASSDNTYKSVAALYEKAGVMFMPGQRGGDTTIAEWLLGDFWRNPQKPRYRITTDCPNLIREIGMQRFKDFSDKVAMSREQPDQLIDKDNHAWDSLKIFLLAFPPNANLSDKKPIKTASFRWWKEQGKRPGGPRTFRLEQREMVS